MKTFLDFDIHVPAGATGNVKVVCPACKHNRKPKNKNNKDLSVNVSQGVWKCHNCDYTGTLYEKEAKEYVRPIEIKSPPQTRMQAWFKTRGINQETLKHFNISEKLEWMPQTSKDENCIAFPYVKHGQVVNYKFRDGAKNFKMVKDAELCVFNYDGIRGKSTVVITEGEIDAMSVFESGACLSGNVGVCSVPNGASKGSQKLEYMDNSWQAFNDSEKIIVATDNDEPGLALKVELSRRLGKHRCFEITYPEGCKDLNEVLVKYGAKGITDCLNASKAMPVEGIIFLDDFEADIDYIYENGEDEGVTIGYPTFDKYYRFSPGRLSVWTGVPGSGKSTFLDQVLIRLSNRHQWRHGVCSYEKQPYSKHFKTLSSCYIGKPFDIKHEKRMTVSEKDKAKEFFRKYFFWFKHLDEDLSIDGIINKAIHLVKAYGIEGLVIDPYNYIESKRKANQTETEYVSEVLGKLCLFARNYGVHVFLVAHPVKMKKDSSGEFEVPNLYNISGSHNFYAKPDNGITVHRNRKSGMVTIYIQKIRYEPDDGKLGNVDFVYDVDTYRYREEFEPNYTIEHLWKPHMVQTEAFPTPHEFEKPWKGFGQAAAIEPRHVVDSDDILPF